MAEGAGLSPSTVREALAAMHEEGLVTRRKRASEGAGNNPYQYRAIPPGDLVKDAAGRVQSGLNAVFTLDERLGGDDPVGPDVDAGPVRVSVGADDDRARPPGVLPPTHP